jgi:hypothetical protein
MFPFESMALLLDKDLGHMKFHRLSYTTWSLLLANTPILFFIYLLLLPDLYKRFNPPPRPPSPRH